TSPTPITTNPTVAAKVREKLEKFDKLIEDGKLPAKFAEEGRKLLQQMPRLKSQQTLRKAYQQVLDAKLTVEKFDEQRTQVVAKNKLERSVGVKLAREILKGAEQPTEGFVRDVKRGGVDATQIRGLYRRTGERLASALAERAGNARKMSTKELRELL